MSRFAWSTRWLAVAGAAALSLALLPGTGADGASTTNVNVVGYSVLTNAYKALEADFQQTPAGQNVTFTNSFGASDTQTNNVASGQPADLVNLSYTPNITTLVNAGVVPGNWRTQEVTLAKLHYAATGKKQVTTFPTPGIVTDSVVVFLVRKGNPLGISGWSSLTGAGVQIVTPNPQTSGSAKWNLLAAYASQIASGKKQAAAEDFTKAVLENTVAQPSSGSQSLAAFLAGTGNVLLSYECDARAAVAAGDAVQIVTPAQTLLIENPLALTTSGLKNPAAVAFYKYLFSPAGQTVFAAQGFRPVVKSVWAKVKGEFPAFSSKNLWLVSKFFQSGWADANPVFFSSNVAFGSDKTHPIEGIVTYLERFAGANAG